MANPTGLLFLALITTSALSWTTTTVDAEPIKLSNADFNEHVKEDGKIWFIKFFAPWCGHCKRLVPAWEELAETMAGDDTWRIAHVDCTTSTEVCTKHEIRGYPTLKVFHNGKEFRRYTGARDVESLKTFINTVTHDLWQAEGEAAAHDEA
ncbi:hypothetical protein CBR_g16056 [Chara braunii]|uniref:Thioredoxin domain-containing protein n=1 Tax=Chara braunii TaxID=69332 RepID=A0A388JSZ6_CHABU|nr:hypothetical protein CBR_g16056 [Chara braunii]|eukprot:GBG60934.1 hypothetical protein CBR_g16056 [Chara braunii]